MSRPSNQSAILAHGLDLVHRNGLSSTGVAAIAAAARVPKGSFYNHFKSKDHFGQVILEKYFEEVSNTLREELNSSEHNGLDGITSYFTRLRNYNIRIGLDRGCLIGSISAEASQLSTAARKKLFGLLTEWTELLADGISKGQRDGSIRNMISPSTTAAILLDAWQGALLRSKAQRTAEAQDRFIEILLPQVLGKGFPDAL
jgi:TetR/AcrR family transcriptional regulator, transcriptional repressor for nem operon